MPEEVRAPPEPPEPEDPKVAEERRQNKQMSEFRTKYIDLDSPCHKEDEKDQRDAEVEKMLIRR